MRIAIVDESATRAAVIQEGLAALDGCEIFVVSERRGLVSRIGEIEPDIVLMDLGNPSRDVLEEYFTVSRALARPIAMFVDESDEESIAASIDAGVSAYVVDGLAPGRIRPLLDLAVRRFNAFARLQADLDEARGKLADRETIDRAKRILPEWLAGRTAEPLPDRGPIVCICHDVGERDILAAIDGGARDADAVGACTRAGTNCGSCRPIIARLIEDALSPLKEPAE